MARFVNGESAQAKEPDVRAIFSRADGTPLQAGDTYRNPAYAETLGRIASQGPRALLEPPLRDAIIARTRAEPRAGTLEAADFDAYQPRVADPVCGPYLVYIVCVPPPPSSGIALLAGARHPRAHRHRFARARGSRRPGTCSRWRAG